MRVVIITPSLNLGGAERSLVKLVQLIKPMTERINIICIGGADDALLDELPSESEIVSLGAASSANPLVWLRVHFRLRRLRPDLVVGWSTYANFVTIVATRFLINCKVVLSERNYTPQIFNRAEVSSGRRRLILCLMRCLYRKADVITANSYVNVKFLKKFIGKGPIYHLLPNTIDTADIDKRATETVSPILNDIKGPRILAVGCLSCRKGFDILLRAIAIVRAVYPWSLVIVGEGPEKEVLKYEAKSLGLNEAIRWVGKVPNPFPYYRWADIVVVPSRYEGFPNVPLEAMAIGRSVICSDCKTGPRELTAGGRMGVLVPVGDEQALAKAILELGIAPAKRERLGQTARKHILKNYDMKVMRNCYAQVLGLKE